MTTAYGKTENLFRRNDETHKLIIGSFRSPYVRQIKDWLVTEKIDGTNMRIILDWSPVGPAETKRGTLMENAFRPVVDIRGRSDNADLPKNFLQEAFGVEQSHELTSRLVRSIKVLLHCGECDDEMDVRVYTDPIMMVIYGEGYGAGIQSGGNYAPKKQFRAFDVATFRYRDISVYPEAPASAPEYSRPFWRTWDEICDVCEVAGIKTVPLLSSTAPLEEIVDRVPTLRSAVAAEDSGVEYKNAEDLPFAEGVVARTDPYLFDHNRGRVFFKLKREDL